MSRPKWDIYNQSQTWWRPIICQTCILIWFGMCENGSNYAPHTTIFNARVGHWFWCVVTYIHDARMNRSLLIWIAKNNEFVFCHVCTYSFVCFHDKFGVFMWKRVSYCQSIGHHKIECHRVLLLSLLMFVGVVVVVVLVVMLLLLIDCCVFCNWCLLF